MNFRSSTVIALAAVALTPATASAVSLVDEAGSTVQGPAIEWLSGLHAPLPDASVTVIPTACTNEESSVACAMDWPGRPTVFFGPGGSRDDFLHELGHVFDYTVMTDRARGAFQRVMRDSRPWRTEPNSPHERFAEAWRMCATFRKAPRSRITGLVVGGAYGFEPKTVGQWSAACNVIAGAAAGVYA